MDQGESVLDGVLDEEILDFDGDDVEMADAEENPAPAPIPAAAPGPAPGGGGGGGGVGPAGGNKRKKRKPGNKKKKKGGPHGPPKIADINRFVLDTCKRLKERKSYLVWNAVGCLGVSAVNDLVREVEAIQKCGGQTIADGSRFRTGGGILWNILKSREPKAYKEIMAKGKELEKQFRYTKNNSQSSRNEDASSQGSALVDGEIDAEDEKIVLDDPDQLVDVGEAPLPANKAERKPVADRIRVPVAYDDLFEEGEIHGGEPQN